ncbi:hypothetical protein [Mesorhizobium sp. AR07]|uniref:hypothetical protein n=1 Tax=Mesorhizobium sp. AR07 TaxID=2865838 RepID=UPI002160B8BA|nr:hypothetical protein [Mesorhizobium sp. AR07]
MRHAVSVNGQFRVGGEVRIDRHCCRRQFSPQLIDKVFTAPGKAKRIAIFCQPRFAIRPRQELSPVIIEGFGADNEQIRCLQRVRQMDEDADFERATIDHCTATTALRHEALPSLRGKAQVKRSSQFVTAGVTMFDHDRQCVKQAAILCRRANLHQVQQLEQEAAGFGVDWPQ